MTSQHKLREIPFIPVKCNNVNNVENVLYMSHKIHLLLKFIEIDEICVYLLQNYSKSDCHKLQKSQQFQETSTLHLMFQFMLS